MDKDDVGNSVKKRCWWSANRCPTGEARCWWSVNRCPTGEAQFDEMKGKPSEYTHAVMP